MQKIQNIVTFEINEYKKFLKFSSQEILIIKAEI